MPRGRPRKNKQVKSTLPIRPGITTFKNPFRWMESYTSLLMGVVVVIVAVLFVVSFAKQNRHIQQTSSIATGAPVPTGVTQTLPGVEKRQREYIVQAGDDLWHIAEKEYKSGYNWVDIASANNIANPGTIFTGDKLVIPDVQPKTLTVQQEQPVVENAITGNSYTVVKGDDLWNIAVRAYGDGYKWVNIAKANQLANPSIIHSGNILKIPR